MRHLLIKLHRWAGLVLLAYVLMISLSGAALVYRPELYKHFEPKPVPVAVGEALQSDEALLGAARRAFPGEEPVAVWRGKAPHHAVEVELESGDRTRGYLFDPYTAEPLQPALPLGFRAVSWLVSLHTELLGGAEGRLLNGVIGLAFFSLALGGALAWRPALKRSAPRSLRRWHMTVGIWAAAFALMWGLTGFYLAHPDFYNLAAEYFEPLDPENLEERTSDKISYWLAYAHFGRFGGRLYGCGPGPCDHALKLAWIAIGLVPAFLAVSGGIVWWRARRVRARARQGS